MFFISIDGVLKSFLNYVYIEMLKVFNITSQLHNTVKELYFYVSKDVNASISVLAIAFS